MNPTLIHRSEIDPTRWNEHICASLQCVIYAQTFYLDIVCDEWHALVWPSKDEFKIVMPLPIRRKFGFNIVYQPHFCQYLGLFSLNELTAYAFEAFLRTLVKRFSYISTYHFNPENYFSMTNLPVSFPETKWWTEQTHWLEIGDYAKIFSGYTNDRKTNVRRGSNVKWNVDQGKDLVALIQLFEDNHSVSIGGVSATSLERLRTLFQSLYARGNAKVLYASLENEIHAGIMLVEFRQRIIYLFNAADRIGRKGNARTWMLDQHFQNHENRSATFDFESPQIESIASFYKSFGSKPVSYFAISANQLPFPLNQMQRLRKRLYLKTRQCLF
ncbi:GNAT family N-acetyltransferase [Dyadobacter sp. CY326]|uniref:GNAT family N-acetyltransferase n=1 Tax=Dyadobacter sp. CY326 TaxID=2907300 RepID=UPI001F414F39|nr:GNAT family N-acetyltransferase [Dyadobacter sp. CY326]MCE7064128.1 GNAT family N-acetyltransferase [Dyadobacter sp. CY326]